MNFSEALELMRAGKKIYREKFPDHHFFIADGRCVVKIKDSANIMVGVNFFLGSDDILADDWEIVE